ncbi:MYCBP-associated protein-like isoform X1 [Biomphalaria glabrata]|nr:MYCBP-associated protein-like isoform X1 [Biomphalaria glabrata]
MSSSKLSVKNKGKESRPKSSDRLKKKVDDNPQKSTTPSQESEERLGSSRHVLWNEEIEKLQIKQEELKKIHLPHPPAEEKKAVVKKVPVKKIKQPVVKTEPIPDKPLLKVNDGPVDPKDYSGYAGPRYDEKGDVIPYSILGKYEDFYKEAVKRGDLLETLPTPRKSEKVDSPTVKYEKKKNIKLNQDEHNALKNWNAKMNERKRQQEHISNLLNKPLEELAMNQADNFRAIEEQRYLIEKAIPKIDYGKGYRVGSEFWNQRRQLGDDLNGIHMTLTQTQKGNSPPVEHVGLSQVVKAEKGCEWHGKTNVHFRYPWHKSEFLNQRLQQLQPYIDEVSSWKPEFESLQVIGSSNPYKNTEELMLNEEEKEDIANQETEALQDNDTKENQEPHRELKPGDVLFGPSLLIDGQLAQWTGDGTSHADEIALEARVTFEGFTDQRVTSHLDVVNNGTTTIYFDWTKLGKNNPFDLNQKPIQRFYFNNAPGVILPGEKVTFPFVFKSSEPGVYTEQWKLETRPTVCGGAALLITLRGIGILEDKFKEQREKLEKELSEKQAVEICSRLLNELIHNIRTPERTPSPIDAYVTEEELFLRNNAGFQYDHQKISQLKDLYSQLFPEEERAENVWSLSIEDLLESIMKLDEDDERKDNMLQLMNEIVGKLTYIPTKPLLEQMQYIGYQIFIEAIDRMVGESLLLRQTMGLPIKNQDETETIGQSNEAPIPVVEEAHNSAADEGRRGIKSKSGSQNKVPVKDVRASKTPPIKPDAKGKAAPSPAPATKKTPPPVKTPQAPVALQPSTTEAVPEQNSSEATNVLVVEQELSPAEKLYKSTFALQVYDILGDMADKMDDMFGAMKNDKGNFIY